MDAASDEDLLRRFVQERDLLLGYLRLLLPVDQAEDVFQETFLVVHRRVGDFERGRDFAAWVRGIARNLAMKARERHGRLRPMPSEALLALADRALDEADDVPEADLGALHDCLARLPAAQRRLLDLRYRSGCDLAAIAEQVGRTAAAVQVALSRLRSMLQDCVRQRLRTAP
jgi:RNA polymerase sigma-70 factor (ECF subfamily)